MTIFGVFYTGLSQAGMLYWKSRTFLPQRYQEGDDRMTDGEKFDLILTELKKLDTLEKKFDTFEKKFDTYEEKFDTFEKKFNALDKKFDTLERKVDTLEKKFDTLEEKVEKIDYDVHNLKYQLIKYVADLKSTDEMILNEVERVHEILYKHQRDKAIHTA